MIHCWFTVSRFVWCLTMVAHCIAVRHPLLPASPMSHSKYSNLFTVCCLSKHYGNEMEIKTTTKKKQNDKKILQLSIGSPCGITANGIRSPFNFGTTRKPQRIIESIRSTWSFRFAPTTNSAQRRCLSHCWFNGSMVLMRVRMTQTSRTGICCWMRRSTATRRLITNSFSMQILCLLINNPAQQRAVPMEINRKARKWQCN